MIQRFCQPVFKGKLDDSNGDPNVFLYELNDDEYGEMNENESRFENAEGLRPRGDAPRVDACFSDIGAGSAGRLRRVGGKIARGGPFPYFAGIAAKQRPIPGFVRAFLFRSMAFFPRGRVFFRVRGRRAGEGVGVPNVVFPPCGRPFRFGRIRAGARAETFARERFRRV